MRHRQTSVRVGIVVMALAGSVALQTPATAGQPVTVEGRLEVFHADDFQRGRATHEYFLRTDLERLALRFPDDGPHHLAATRVRVAGNREGQVVTVPSSRPPHVEQVGAGGTGADAVAAATTSGPRDTLVIMLSFTDTPSPVPEQSIMDGEVFTGSTSVAAYYNETSFGQTTLQGAVTDWLPINDASSPCDYDGWGQAARAAAETAGHVLADYEHIVHYFPQTSACQWSGLAQLGDAYSWINGTWEDPGAEWNEHVISHELGHNITLHHSGSLTCQANGVRVALSSNCSSQEYGDPFDAMGSVRYDHFNSFHKAHLGWIPSGNVATVTSGQHTLSAMESSCTDCVQVLRIPRGSEYLYVEYRQPFGFDDYGAADPVIAGASLHLAPDYPLDNQRTRLIDAQPYTTTFLDAALPQGSGFADDGSRVYVETVSAAPASLTVLVRTSYTDPSPTANIGSGHTIQRGVPHTHTGATASDGGKNLRSYKWSLSRCRGTCPTLTNAAGSLQGGSTAIPDTTFTPTKKTGYRLSLTVWDTTGKSVTVSVEERAV